MLRRGVVAQKQRLHYHRPDVVMSDVWVRALPGNNMLPLRSSMESNNKFCMFMDEYGRSCYSKIKRLNWQRGTYEHFKKLDGISRYYG